MAARDRNTGIQLDIPTPCILCADDIQYVIGLSMELIAILRTRVVEAELCVCTRKCRCDGFFMEHWKPLIPVREKRVSVGCGFRSRCQSEIRVSS